MFYKWNKIKDLPLFHSQQNELFQTVSRAMLGALAFWQEIQYISPVHVFMTFISHDPSCTGDTLWKALLCWGGKKRATRNMHLIILPLRILFQILTMELTSSLCASCPKLQGVSFQAYIAVFCPWFSQRYLKCQPCYASEESYYQHFGVQVFLLL